MVGLTRIGSEFKPHEGDAFKSALLNNILKTLPTISETSRGFLDAINLKEARENDEGNLWADADKYPDIQDAKDASGSDIMLSSTDDTNGSAFQFAKASWISI